MSDSRRKFLKAGIMATAFAAFPLKNIFSQKGGSVATIPPAQSDPLANYTKATFLAYLNSVFQLHAPLGIVGITLTKVDDMAAPKGGECFSLLFRGGGRAFSQNTYTVVHPSLGTFELFLVPVGTDQNGTQGYLATINRLSLVDAANITPPEKRDGSIKANATPSPTPKTTPTPAPTPEPTPTKIDPIVITPTATPAPVLATAKTKPKGKGRPSWKNDDNPDLDHSI